MAQKQRALIIGGSVGGLFAGHLLRAAGWDAIVCERSTHDLAGRGAGIGLTQELLEIMDEIGVPFDPGMVALHRSYLWLDRTGAVKHEQPRGSSGSSWTRIYRPLRDTFPDDAYRPGMALIKIERESDGVTGVFADGTRISADLIVAADGNQSTVRAQFQPDVRPRFAGYVVWRGLVDPANVPRETYETVVDHLVFGFPKNEMMLTMLVPGESDNPDTRTWQCYFAWYRRVGSDEELKEIFTDAEGTYHGTAIPPPLIRDQFTQQVRDDARSSLAPIVAEMVERAPQLLLQSIFDFESPRLAFDRVAILGDAAFIARPHIASGVTKAALDARQLVRALDDAPSIEAALNAYDKAQTAFGKKMVAHSRKLGYYIEHDPDAGPSDPEMEKFLDPKHILREYGIAGLLHDAKVPGFEKP